LLISKGFREKLLKVKRRPILFGFFFLNFGYFLDAFQLVHGGPQRNPRKS
jgi:hypothetical protein